jgi:glyoxylase-like metal-dependent hydrolase (beta-lactamase superfamily II)
MPSSTEASSHLAHRRTPGPDPLAGLTVLERGWLSSNNVLLAAGPDEEGATLIDTGHVRHAEQTCQLVRSALAGEPLAWVVNTHLHSDHCGGNAAVQAEFGPRIAVAPGMAEVVNAWDAGRLTYEATGQSCPMFRADRALVAGEQWLAGGRHWEVLAAPGHDPDSMMLIDREAGVLISADALWENGFGVVFPEIQGQPGYDDVGAVLDLIETLPVRWVIPGHGAPFADVAGALSRARRRLAGFRDDPAKHLRYAIKVLVVYHVMEEGRIRPDALIRWAEATPDVRALWCQHSGASAPRLEAVAVWVREILEELVSGESLVLADGWLRSAA